jgi:hypothetical protein
MNIEALLHVVRATHAITRCHSILVIGSQAILGHCLSRGYDFSFCDSMEVDIVPMPESPGLDLWNLVDGSIGERSMFHDTFGYYGHGVSSETAVFPPGWEHRMLCTSLSGTSEEAFSVYFPSTEDLVLSKYIAGREKDLRFIEKVIAEQLVDEQKLLTLLALYPQETLVRESEDVGTRIKQHMALNFQPGIQTDLDIQVKYVVRNGLDPRELEKTMHYVDADKLREELRSAADYPERWGVKQEEFEAWGKMHELGRKREVPTPAGPRVEIVYDNF